jgi:multidrug efflux pump subunit AcrA (membrane-fusion protein)
VVQVKVLKIFMVILMVCGVVFLSVSCSSSSNSATTAKATNYTVKTGTLTVSITGTGNLAYSKTEDLAFELDGYVANVLVEEGDKVTKGQELANLNTTDWKDQISALEKKVTSAKRSVADAQRTVDSKQLAVSQAEIDLANAQYSLNQIDDVKIAQAKIDEIQKQIDYDESVIKDPSSSDNDVSQYREDLATQKEKLSKAYKNLNNVISTGSSGLSTTDNVSISSKVALTIAQAALKVQQEQADLDSSKTAVDNAKLDLADAQSNQQDAQDNLDELNSESPIIKAPFDGYITKVNVNGGDEVFKGKVAVVIADPTQFDANIKVAESDIYSVKLGGDATVSVDALSDLTFPARITFISPTATVSSGVVNYSVVVTLTSLKPVSTTTQTTAQNLSGQSSLSQGNLPTGTMTRTRPTGSFSGFPQGTPPAGFANMDNSAAGTNPTQTGSTAAAATTTAAAATTTDNVTLMDGLSATVSIVSKQATNALIVPSKALTKQGGNYSVQVINGTQTETRSVQIGITDGTNTVITSGLTAGEVITYGGKIASSGSTTTTTTANRNNGVIPGVGGGGPPPGGF